MRAAALALFGVLALVSGQARADVMEIGENGAISTRSGVAAAVWGGDVASANIDPLNAVPEVPAAAVTMIEAPAALPLTYAPSLTQAAARYRISPNLLAALVGRESHWRTAAVSSKGAIGLTQLMPATARAMRVDPTDPAANLAGGAHYLRQMLDLFDGDVERALAAYNAGPGRVVRAGGVPAIAETRAYVSVIIDRLGEARSIDSDPGLLGAIR